MIRPTPDASITVQAAFRDIEDRLRSLESAEGNAARVRAELDNAVKSLRRDIAQVATKPTYLDFNDVFRAGPAHMHGYVPDPGNHPSGAGWTLGSDGTWSPGVVETVPHNAAGTSIAQRVVNVHGSMAVQSALSADTILARQITEIQPHTHQRHGFELEPDGSAKQTITYNASTQVVTVTPTNGTLHFWIDGKRFEKAGAQAAPAHGTTTGKYFIYYDNTGTLRTSAVETPWSVRDRTATPVALVYWSSTLSDGVCFYECHTADRVLEIHYNLHFSRGTQYISGYDLTGYTLATDSDAAVTYAIASGVIADEDIRFASAGVADGGDYVIFYRSGADGAWVWDPTNAFPFIFGTTYPSYNQWTGATWQMTEASGSGVAKYLNYYICATTAVTPQAAQAFLIPGQTVYSTQAGAQAEGLSSLSLGTLPFEEVAPLYRITLEFKNSYAGTHKTKITQVTSIKNQTVTVTGGSVGITDHGALTGLLDDDHTHYLKEEASGGVASEVPDHTHADAANCGTVAHNALTGLTTGDDHTQYLLETAAATTYAKRLSTNVTPVTTSSGTLQDLMTYTLPGGTLAADGSYIHVVAAGQTAADADAKTITLNFGAYSVTYVTGAVNNLDWLMEMWVYRTGATSQLVVSRGGWNGNMLYCQGAAATETLSGNVTVKCTGDGINASDIVQTLLSVEYYP